MMFVVYSVRNNFSEKRIVGFLDLINHSITESSQNSSILIEIIFSTSLVRGFFHGL